MNASNDRTTLVAKEGMEGLTNKAPRERMTDLTQSCFDRTQALGRVGGDLELLKEIAQLFLDESASMLDAIEKAIASNDARALERAAHTLKGCVANFDTGVCFDAAMALETAGRDRQLEEASRLYSALTSVLDRLRPELTELAQE